MFFVVKPQTLQDRGGAGFRRPGVDIGQARLDFGNPSGITGGLGLGHQVCAFCVCRQNCVEDCDLGRRHFLRDTADAGLIGQFNAATLQHQFATDQAEEGGFSGAIAPHNADLMAGGDGGRGMVDQRAAFDGIRDIFDPEHGPSVSQSTALVNGERHRTSGQNDVWEQSAAGQSEGAC
ncbi:hypothetical protein TRM7557_00221 [Tritonibacter multivorans]|uniref:Uncharacterized protein n=1 Tax=Tritonibacter multivorans TaxID=928856 RepID=A0A0P1G0F6_9RHOB|nr:hypothetical protein TRM7557_00221 [Tritonibacter multivorans]